MIRSLYILVFIFLCPFYANAGWFGPKGYDECILESMKGMTSDVAARKIMRLKKVGNRVSNGFSPKNP